MSSITVELAPEQLVKLQTLADRLGTSVECLVRSTVEDLLVGPDERFNHAANYVAKK